ncbi:MAG: lipopolysaccharide heptosyltransferase II, partial [Mariprofundaceae bacterium]|nr:lipopolysaccharide heptosyltransferase II [Mariprofundaceae bacterium]
PWLLDLIPFLNLPEARYSSSMPEHADIALMFPNSFRAAWMAWRAGSERRIGFRGQWRRFLLTDAPAPRVNLLTQHHREYYLDLVEQTDFMAKTGIAVREREVRLSCPETAVREGEQALRQQGLDPALTIAFAPGAQFGGAKRYPPESWASVAGWLSKQGYHILVIGTPAERATGTQVTSRCPGPAWNASGETTLGRALQLLASSRCLLCNDSGLMHVAAGLQKPVVAIFGATDPARTSPSGSHVRLLYHPAACSPCLKRECSVPGQPCMANVLPEDVRDACLGLLSVKS